MDMEDIIRVLLSQPAVLTYEMILAAVLIFLIVWLSRKRKQRKLVRAVMQEQQIKKVLDDSLANQRRRQ